MYQNEPKLFRNEQGRPAGLFADTLDAIADAEGWNITYVDCDWEQCLDMLERGELDLMPDVVFTRSRAKRFDYHEVAVVDSFSQFYAPPGTDLDTFEDLSGKRIAVLAEGSQHEGLREREALLREGLNMVPAPSFHAAFEAVSSGRADAVVTNNFFGERNASEYGLEPSPLVIQPAQLYFAAPPGQHAFELEAIDRHLEEWKAEAPSPYYDSLQRWTSNPTEKAIPDWVWQVAIGALIALGLAALVIWLLRRQVAVRTRHLHERNEELRQKQRHLSLIVDHGPDLVVHADCDGHIVYVNSALTAVTGYDPETVRGEDLCQRFAEPLDDEVRESLESAQTETAVYESVLHHRDGGTVPVEVRVGSIQDRDGDPWLFQYTIRDLSERVAAIEARRQSEARAQRIIKSLPLAALVWRMTDEGVVLEFLNDAAVQLFPSGSEAWCGSLLDELYAHDHPVPQLVRRCLTQESGERVQANLKLSEDSQERTLVLFSGFLKPDSVLVHIEDVTERESLRRQLQASQRLETAGLLAGGVAHDFNNLLTVINSSAQLALHDIDESETAHEDVEQILHAGQKAANITRQLLTFTKQSETEPQLISLSETVGQFASMLRHFIPESITLDVDLRAEDERILIDPTQIEQVVMNLVLNARDAIGQQGRIRVATFVLPDEEKAVLEVADDGAGMDEETLNRVFEPFFTTKPKDRGTGLGLSMVYGAVTGAGGNIDIESEPGRGTTVVIELPMVDESTLIEVAERNRSHLAEPGERILVVEDDESVRRVVERIVKRAGYEVLTASSGREALALLRRGEAISLVLTDVVMPEQSGVALVERMREEFPDVETLFMSGYTNDELNEHGIGHEQPSVIQKPFAPQELAARLRSVLDG